MEFQKQHTFEQRVKESKKIINKYPNRIPVIVEQNSNSQDQLPLIDKKKYLVPADLTVSQFIHVIRKRLKLRPDQAIYLFTETGTLPVYTRLMSENYKAYKNDDGFLYFSYSAESTFGC